MSNAITFPDHDYLGDAITLTDDAPPADELQSLRVQVEALTKERDELKAHTTMLEDERDGLVWVMRFEAGELSDYAEDDMTMCALRVYEIKSKYLPALKIGA